MKLVGLYVYKWNEERSIELCKFVDLSMLWFYQRGIAKDHVNFNSRTISSRIKPGFRATVALEENLGNCFCWTTQDGISVTCITDMEYPEKAAMTLLTKIILDFREKFKNSGILESASVD